MYKQGLKNLFYLLEDELLAAADELLSHKTVLREGKGGKGEGEGREGMTCVQCSLRKIIKIVTIRCQILRLNANLYTF